ncbi:MAG: biosynthetic arginine decarboxylase [Gammaproteobacteria bacterium]
MNDTNWSLEAARKLYNCAGWGNGYFDISEAGRAVMRSRAGGEVDLHALAHELRDAGLRWPVLVRFEDVLHDRVGQLRDAFAGAMQDVAYRGDYTPVYPIKVNQQRSVVEQILASGHVGLEAGSKPELMAVLALSRPGGVIVCNGYKDREYIRLALIARLLGHRAYIVIEKPSELHLVLREAQDLGVEPWLGMRIRLASIGKGKWQNTGGEKAKFGLSAGQALELVETLREADALPALKLLHFHMGSQIANIRDVQNGLREAAHYFAELHRLGAQVRVVDVGGGLGVDYEGTRSRSDCSINYSIQEYANSIVRSIHDSCEAHGLPHPDIYTESGRAMTAHHAVLLTNVIDTEAAPGQNELQPPTESDDRVLHALWELYRAVGERTGSELYHDAVYWLNEAQLLFTHEQLGLAERAQAEQLYFAVCRRLMDEAVPLPAEIRRDIEDKLAEKYFCNFSVFQSIPDVWAIHQIFPIMPLARLNEAPQCRAVLQDLTCDSDGRVDRYVSGAGLSASLPLHAIEENEPYLLGIFMVGAYQEILGDLHNLFGDTDSINVALDSDGKGYTLRESESGDAVEELLSLVHYDTVGLLRACEDKVAAADLDQRLHDKIISELSEGLAGYTYLED